MTGWRNRSALGVLAAVLLGAGSTSLAQDPELTVSELMNALITPATNTLWGAYQVQTDAQWLELENAAFTVIAAAKLLQQTGAYSGEADWQTSNRELLSAARAALQAIANRDEEALSSAGNDQLYPPCESCHQRYMSQ